MHIINRDLFLRTKNIDLNTVHLYEHLVIMGFYNYLEKTGTSTDLFGWINGQTFDKVMFIYSCFYNPNTAKLFDQYFASKLSFTEAEIDYCLATIEVEERSIAKVNKPQLLHDLEAVASLPWNKPSNIAPTILKSINFTKSAKDYHDLTIEIELQSKNIDLQTLFLRVEVMIYDIIHLALQKNIISYVQGTSPVTILSVNDLASSIKVITVKNKTQTASEIQSICQTAIDNFDVKKNFKDIKRHFQIFAKEPLWQEINIFYYRYSGILTLNQEIANLATLKNIDTIFKNTRITVHRTNKDDLACLL